MGIWNTWAKEGNFTIFVVAVSRPTTAVFSYTFLGNDYATSFKVKIQFDHFWSENNSAKLPFKYFKFSEK